MKIKLFRPLTNTFLLVNPPINLSEFKVIPEYVSNYLNSWVDYEYPGFEINKFICA
jgi:hypothetical protein